MTKEYRPEHRSIDDAVGEIERLTLELNKLRRGHPVYFDEDTL